MSRTGTHLASFAVAAAAMLALGVGAASAAVYSNPAGIGIPNFGNASPYPSTIPVGGQPGAIIEVELTLNGFTHSFVHDVGAVLVGQDGRALLFMDGIGDPNSPGTSATAVDLTFDDDGSFAPNSGATLASGSYAPTAYALTDFPSPGPGTSYFEPGPLFGDSVGFHSAFEGFSANQTWQLFVRDSELGDAGAINAGWSINITTDPTLPAAPSVTGTLPGSGADNNTPSVTGNADPGTTVNVYGSPGCAGAPAGGGNAAQFASTGIPVPVPDSSVSTFYAKAFSATGASICSASFATYAELTPGPATPPRTCKKGFKRKKVKGKKKKRCVKKKRKKRRR